MLNLPEVRTILQAAENLKHKTILTVIYSAGLRVSEAIRLRLEDLDFERRQIRIVNSKGKKDRVTLLAEKTRHLVEQYRAQYQPKTFLFESQTGGNFERRTSRPK